MKVIILLLFFNLLLCASEVLFANNIQQNTSSTNHKLDNDTITNDTIINIADHLDVPHGTIYAIIKTESDSILKYKNGLIPVLFERHIVYKYVSLEYGIEYANKMSVKYKYICNPIAFVSGNIQEQYNKLKKASSLFGSDIAYSSVSLGFFQIMGFNHKAIGYNSALQMSKDFHENPQNQVPAFISFLKNHREGKLLNALRHKDWRSIALYYNGKNYKKNQYDKKLQEAYDNYIKGF